jgi:hypothetical protein
MARFHGKAESKTETTKHQNFMGGSSYFLGNPITTLRIAASSCFFGEPQYYRVDDDSKPKASGYRPQFTSLADGDLTRLRTELGALSPTTWKGKGPTEIIENAIDEALAFDAEGTLREAARLRQEENIRTTPQVILVRASHHVNVRGTSLLKLYGPQIIRRADEPAVGLAYHVYRYGKDKPLPNGLKRAWKRALEGFNEYQLAKYRQESKGSKAVDVVNLVHANSAAIDKLMKGELKTTDATWESIISREGSSAETWHKALGVMGHMAMLRNVRNLLEKGVDPALFTKALVEGAATGKQLPFRYFSAYKAVEGKAPPQVLDAIEECLMQSLGNLPHFSGRVASLCDNSGSAWGAMTSSAGTMPVAEIANLTGVITGMVADEGYVGVFGDNLEMIPIRKKSSVFDQLKTTITAGRGIGGSTENGIWLFWDKAIREKQHWDHVFVYSDMQAGHGGLYGINAGAYREYAWPSSPRQIDVGKLVNKYRATVNPNVKVYLVQMAGYTDTIMPEFYKNTYILGGWGDGLLRFAAEMAKLEQAPKEPGQG